MKFNISHFRLILYLLTEGVTEGARMSHDIREGHMTYANVT